MACQICKKTKTTFLIKVPDYEYNIKYSALYSQCSNCETIWRIKPNKITSNNKIFYKKNYLPVKGNVIYDKLKNLNAIYERKKILDFLPRNFKNQKKTILDIACGKGFLLEKLSQNIKFKCFGIDLNIKNHTDGKIKYIKSSYNNFKTIKKINPDLIIINNFIEHMEDFTFFTKIIKKMKKGSYLIILTPDCNSNGRIVFSKFWSGYHAPRHKIIFNQKSIIKIFSQYKNMRFSHKKLFDPFTNIISISNFIKQSFISYNFVNFFKIFYYLLNIFVDINYKNRIILIGRKS